MTVAQVCVVVEGAVAVLSADTRVYCGALAEILLAQIVHRTLVSVLARLPVTRGIFAGGFGPAGGRNAGVARGRA